MMAERIGTKAMERGMRRHPRTVELGFGLSAYLFFYFDLLFDYYFNSEDEDNDGELIGRRFNIGKIKDVSVIYVMTGEQTLNAGITVQLLLDCFDIKGIVHYGTAGSANESLSLGDVSVPKYVAFTGSWKWKEFHSKPGDLPELRFGAFNLPAKGGNLLAKIDFTPQELYSTGLPMEQVFWLSVEPKWFSLASRLVVRYQPSHGYLLGYKFSMVRLGSARFKSIGCPPKFGSNGAKFS
ncbi:hypothetical protein U1Q18_004958 [Sarracenia purpurea var. burkii]